MTEQRHLIWSNYDLDYEDWRDDLEEDHPELTEDERMALMYEINNRYLDDERVNLNIQLDQPILVIADLGLWNGRRTGYQEISSGNIRDCLYSGRDIEYATWYVDKLGDLRCDGRSTACAVTATLFAAPMQATSTRRDDQRSGPPSPSSPGASLKSPRQQRACCNLMRKRRDRAWRKNWTLL